ncbi:MAG: flavodoxin family protein [Candidatus Hodarchaeota archaeon]
MKSLVVYYSRTGNTGTVGKAIAKELKADLDEIIDLKKRSGPIGWLRAGYDSGRKKLTSISVKKDPDSYDPVIIGTPIWNNNMTPAVRTYITDHDLSGKNLAFFCVGAGSSFDNTIEGMKKLVPKSFVVGTLGISRKEVESGTYKEKIETLTSALKP